MQNFQRIFFILYLSCRDSTQLITVQICNFVWYQSLHIMYFSSDFIYSDLCFSIFMCQAFPSLFSVVSLQLVFIAYSFCSLLVHIPLKFCVFCASDYCLLFILHWITIFSLSPLFFLLINSLYLLFFEIGLSDLSGEREINHMLIMCMSLSLMSFGHLVGAVTVCKGVFMYQMPSQPSKCPVTCQDLKK